MNRQWKTTSARARAADAAGGNDRGQTLPLVALVLWAAVAVAVVVAMVGARAADRARAQSGADAVALGVAADSSATDALATANGVAVDSVIERGGEVRVDVSLGEVGAVAQAQQRRPTWVGLDPLIQDALARAEAILGVEVPIVSGLRSRAEQQRLWDARATNPYPVAPPGTSAHELGLAVDVPLATARLLVPIQGLTGLCQPLPGSDPVHFTLCRMTPIR